MPISAKKNPLILNLIANCKPKNLLLACETPITPILGIMLHISTIMTLVVYYHLYKEDSAVWTNQDANFFQKLIGAK